MNYLRYGTKAASWSRLMVAETEHMCEAGEAKCLALRAKQMRSARQPVTLHMFLGAPGPMLLEVEQYDLTHKRPALRREFCTIGRERDDNCPQLTFDAHEAPGHIIGCDYGFSDGGPWGWQSQSSSRAVQDGHTLCLDGDL